MISTVLAVATLWIAAAIGGEGAAAPADATLARARALNAEGERALETGDNAKALAVAREGIALLEAERTTHEDLAKFLSGLPYWPIGMDAEHHWV